MSEPGAVYVLTPHARGEMARRGIAEAVVRGVLDAPEQRLAVSATRDVLQSRVEMGDPAKLYLVRVFVDVDRDPPEVVTVYRTSNIRKYWRADA